MKKGFLARGALHVLVVSIFLFNPVDVYSSMFWRPATNCLCPEGSKVLTGQACSGDAICAGVFDDYNYMVTPAGCTDTTHPVCAGKVDTVTRKWSPLTEDIPGVENTLNAVDPSGSGQSNTLEYLENYTSKESPMSYCGELVFGGYSDWYAPSKTELAFLMCQTDQSIGLITGPNEHPGCGGTYGKTQSIRGFVSGAGYWTSTERSSTQAWAMNASNFQQGPVSKDTALYIRCIRRFE